MMDLMISLIGNKYQQMKVWLVAATDGLSISSSQLQMWLDININCAIPAASMCVFHHLLSLSVHQEEILTQMSQSHLHIL